MGKIRFRISPDGTQITAEGEGFSGKKCTEVTDKILRKLGKIADRKLKSEYYELEVEESEIMQSD